MYIQAMERGGPRAGGLHGLGRCCILLWAATLVSQICFPSQTMCCATPDGDRTTLGHWFGARRPLGVPLVVRINLRPAPSQE